MRKAWVLPLAAAAVLGCGRAGPGAASRPPAENAGYSSSPATTTTSTSPGYQPTYDSTNTKTCWNNPGAAGCK